MGNLGEHFALGVYLGTQGLEGYRKIAAGDIPTQEAAVLHSQKCLMASYEDREYLESEDRAVLKELGLKFRGRGAWPVFRDYRPGYLPWFITAEQARFLTLALQQALDVTLRFGDNSNLLEPPDDGLYLVRVPERTAGGLVWSDQWLAPAPIEQEITAVPQVDEPRIQRIKQSIGARQGIWEADFFYTPTPIQERKSERPYFPYMLLWVDRRSQMILPPEITTGDNYRARFQSHFLDLVEQARFMPQEICVLQPEAIELLEPITQRLAIKLRRARRLEALEDARASLTSYFGQLY
jgi:hypothetical protein